MGRSAVARLESLRIQGFKSVEDQTLHLRSINILIGANGSGKSNVLELFSYLRAIRRRRLAEYVETEGGAERLLHFGAKRTAEITVRLKFDGIDGFSLTCVPTKDDRLRIQLASSGVESPDWLTPADADDLFPDAGPSWIPRHVRDEMDRWETYHFDDTGLHSPLTKTAGVEDNRGLRADGANLAPYLLYLRERHPSRYDLVRRAVRLVAPFFEDFTLEPRRRNPETILLEWRHVGADTPFPASSASNGTLRFMALATLLLQPTEDRPSLILIDEPELGLHSYAVQVLGALIHQAATDSQILVATQSPLLLDLFDPEDVVVVDREAQGTSLKRLKEEDLAEWLEDYSLGQLWEKNVLGGRPSPARANVSTLES